LLRYGLGADAPVPRRRRHRRRCSRRSSSGTACGAGFVRADLRFIHEYYTGMCAHLLEQHAGAAITLHDPASIVCFEDHLSYVERSPVHVANNLIGGVRRLSRRTARSSRSTAEGLRLRRRRRRLAAASRTRWSPSDSALPGTLIVGTDSHTPHSGALGCVAIGVGTTDMANAFLTGAVRLGRPEVLRIEVDGRLPPGTSAKDLALHLLALPEIRAGAGVGRVFEFGGDAVRALGIDERATLTNMTAELGGLTGLVEPDVETVHFLRERRGIAFELEPWMRSDPGAAYAATLRVDARALSPMVARPGDPGLGVPIADLAERPRVDIAYCGSCTAGKREDFAQYHAVLAWAAQRACASRRT
jgi:3-isopropylmalate/(R)-2-methylmalate dehydratase large subunit